MLALSHVSNSDADRILKRVAELDAERPDASEVSVDELREIAREAGFDPALVDRAISETVPPPEAASPRPWVDASGALATRFEATRSVPARLSADQLLRAVEMWWPYFESAPDVQFKKGRLVWRDRRKLSFELVPGLDSVEISVSTPRLVGQKMKWQEWVGRAADQIEVMVRTVATAEGSSEASDPAGVSDR